jgi:hypothetical protein
VSDLPPTPDLAALVEELRAQVRGLRAANARLREVVAGKDELLAGKDGLLANQDGLIEAQREQLGNYAEVVGLQADRAEVQDQLVESQAELIDRLTAENAELRRRLSLDSSNSSLPPSSDPPAAKAKRRKAASQRERSKTRKPGGQTGREGSGLDPSDHVDQVERVEPAECSTCGQPLDKAAPDEGCTPVQLWDIPPIELTVTQFDLVRRRCPAGHLTQAQPPAGVAGPVCYGPNIRAAVTQIAYLGHVSMERTATLLADLLGCPVSTGFVASCLTRLADKLDGFEADLKDALVGAERLHHDETPVPVNGGSGYVYAARADGLVWYGAHEHRGHAATDGFGILPRFAGVLVRDDWAGYHKYSDPGRGGKVTGVQLCCAHLMRDLQAVWEADPQGQAWAAQMRQTLRKARAAVDAAIDAGTASLSPATLGQLRGLYANTAEQGVAANAPGVKGRSKEARKLARRMAERIDQVLYFTVDFDVDWTNNSCEQAIRMAKLQAKVSGSWRSMRGLKAFCRIRSYIATARAHNIPVFTALRDAFLDNPWSIPATA